MQSTGRRALCKRKNHKIHRSHRCARLAVQYLLAPRAVITAGMSAHRCTRESCTRKFLPKRSGSDKSGRPASPATVQHWLRPSPGHSLDETTPGLVTLSSLGWGPTHSTCAPWGFDAGCCSRLPGPMFARFPRDPEPHTAKGTARAASMQMRWGSADQKRTSAAAPDPARPRCARAEAASNFLFQARIPFATATLARRSAR